MSIVLTGGKLINGTGADPVLNATVIVEGGTITRAGPAGDTPIPAGARIIDVTGKTVMPGLINCFIHITEGSPDPTDPFTRLPSYAPLRGAANARKLLDAGITTCRVQGDADYASIAVKHAIEHGLVSGPRIVACGYTIRPVGSARDWVAPAQYLTDPGMCTGPWEVRRAVRMNLLNGADYISVNVGGVVGSNIPFPLDRNDWTQDELDAVADEAQRRGVISSAVNCYVDDSLETCAKAGFGGVIHGGLISERGLEALVKYNIFIVPTLCVFNGYLGSEGEKHFPLWRVQKGRLVEAQLRKMFPKYMEMGVRVVGGSIGRGSGAEARELELMVEYGMSAMQSIVANTKAGAEAIGMLDRLGTLESGKLADLIVVDGDPLTDVKVLQNRKKIQIVMKEGEIVRSDL